VYFNGALYINVWASVIQTIHFLINENKGVWITKGLLLYHSSEVSVLHLNDDHCFILKFFNLLVFSALLYTIQLSYRKSRNFQHGKFLVY